MALLWAGREGSWQEVRGVVVTLSYSTAEHAGHEAGKLSLVER